MFIILYSLVSIRVLVGKVSRRRKVLKCLGFWYLVNDERLSLTTGTWNYYK